jgi:hypothetical protein
VLKEKMGYQLLQAVKMYDEDYKRELEDNIDYAIEYLEAMDINYKKTILEVDFQLALSDNKSEREKIEYKVKTLLNNKEEDLKIRREITNKLMIYKIFDISITNKCIAEAIIIRLSYNIRNALKEDKKDLFATAIKPFKIPTTYYDNENRIELYKEFGIDYKRGLRDMICERQGSAKKDEMRLTYQKNELLDRYDKYDEFIEKEIIRSINQELNNYELTSPIQLKRALEKILKDIHEIFDKLTMFSIVINRTNLLESYVKSRLLTEANPKDYNLKERHKEILDEINNTPNRIFEDNTEKETDVERKEFIKTLYGTETSLRNEKIKKAYEKRRI